MTTRVRDAFRGVEWGRHDEDWWAEHSASWVDAGILSEGQAEEIRRLEAPEHEQRTAPVLGVTAEVLVYVGSLLALMSGVVVVAGSWEQLAFAGRLAIGLGVTLIAFVAGGVLVRIGESGTNRVGSFLWLIGTGGVVMVIATCFAHYEVDAGGGNAVLIGLPVLAIGAALWRNLDRPLQFLTTVAGLALVAGGLTAVLGTPVWATGVLVWLASLVAGRLTLLDRVTPAWLVLALAAVGAIVGAMMLTDLNVHLGPAAAALTAAGIVAVGLRVGRTTLVVIGVLGLVQTLQILVATTFAGPVAALILGTAGLLVVLLVLVRTIRRPST